MLALQKIGCRGFEGAYATDIKCRRNAGPANESAVAVGRSNGGKTAGEQGLAGARGAGRQLAACAACTSSSTQPCPCAWPPPPSPPPSPPPAPPCPALPHAHLQWPTRRACSTPHAYRQRRIVGHLQVTGDVLNRAWFVQQCIAVVKELRLAGLRLSLPDLIGRSVPPFPADPRHCHRVLIVDKHGTVIHFVDFISATAYQSTSSAARQVRLGANWAVVGWRAHPSCYHLLNLYSTLRDLHPAPRASKEE